MKMWHLATVADALAHGFYAEEGKFAATSYEIVAALPTRPAPPPVPTLRGAGRALARRLRGRLGR
jgi:hypothetical protein